MTQEALPALSNQNDEEAVRDEKGPEIFILSVAQDTRDRSLIRRRDHYVWFLLMRTIRSVVYL
jgi:hypothetical protein